MLQWPGNLSDLANLEAVIKAKFGELGCLSNLCLISIMIKMWFHVGLKKMCPSLVHSVPDCVKQIIAMNGEHHA